MLTLSFHGRVVSQTMYTGLSVTGRMDVESSSEVSPAFTCLFFKLLSFACSSPVVSPAGCLICVLFGDDGGLSFFEKTSESKAVGQKKSEK